MRTLTIIGLAVIQLCSLNTTLKAQSAIAGIDINAAKAKHFNVMNDKAERNFRKEFRNVYNPAWIEKEDGFRAKFQENDTKYMVDYDKKGNWVSTIMNYDETKLDSRIAGAVKTAFLGYAIVHVTEIRKGKSTVYLVKIDNQKLLKTVRVINGEMDVYESYIKS
jgi:hypothetical protein